MRYRPKKMRFCGLWPLFTYPRWRPTKLVLFDEIIAWSHSMCIQNLGSMGPTVPEIENFTVRTSSKWKINVIYLVENCLSYNISKSGRKLITGKRDTKQRKIWPLTFICITKMASYQVDVCMWFDRLVTLHTHTKFRLNWTNGFWDTKQRKIWPLTLICITKMASYQLDVFMWFDRLVTLHMHTKFRLNRNNGLWDAKQR